MEAAPTYTLVLSTSVAAADLQAWFDAAAPGAQAVYASGLDLPRDSGGVKLAAALGERKLAHLIQRRDPADRRRWQWIVQKAGGSIRPAASLVECGETRQGSCCTRSPQTQRELTALLEVLRKVANAALPCPSNTVLADMLDLAPGKAGRDRVQYLLGELKRARAIELTSHGRNAPRTIRVTGRAGAL
jgi:hypothetical protein